MSHLCDSSVAGSTVRRDNVLASRCEDPLSNTPLLKPASTSAMFSMSRFPNFPGGIHVQQWYRDPRQGPCRTCGPSTARGVARQAASQEVSRYTGV